VHAKNVERRNQVQAEQESKEDAFVRAFKERRTSFIKPSSESRGKLHRNRCSSDIPGNVAPQVLRVDTPSEFSLRGTNAPAWSQVKKNDDRPSSRSTRKAAGSSGASND